MQLSDYFHHLLKRTYGVFTDDKSLEEYFNRLLIFLHTGKARSKDPQWILLANMACNYLIVQATSVTVLETISLELNRTLSE